MELVTALYIINPAWRIAKEYETPGQLEPQLGIIIEEVPSCYRYVIATTNSLSAYRHWQAEPKAQ